MLKAKQNTYMIYFFILTLVFVILYLIFVPGPQHKPNKPKLIMASGVQKLSKLLFEKKENNKV